MNKRTGKMTMMLTPQELQTLKVALKTASEQLRKQAERAARRAKDAECISARVYDGIAEDIDNLHKKVWTRMLREGAHLLSEITL